MFKIIAPRLGGIARRVSRTASLPRRRIVATLLALAALSPTAAWASPGCVKINEGLLNHTSVFAGGNLNASTARFSSATTDQAINALRAADGATDPSAGSAAYDGATYMLFADEVITLTATATNATAISAAIRRGTSRTAVAEGGLSLTFSGDETKTISYTTTGAESSMGLRTFKSSPAASGTITVAATCAGAVPAPTVTSVSPTSGSTAGGTDITVTGTDFTGFTGLTVGGVAATDISVVSATSITARTPAGAAGTASVLVTTSAGTNAANTLFTYVAPPPSAPVISSPANGSTTADDTPTVQGTAGAGTVTVYVDSIAQGTATPSSGSWSLTTGSLAPGLHTVHATLTSAGGVTSADSATNTFTIVGAPTVTSISPASGPTAGGTSVTIRGTDFTGATAVTIGGASATAITVVDATTITATTPSRSAGTASILVTTPAGTNSANSLFTYAAAPTVTGVNPTSGKAGRSATITGTNFSATASNNAVKFGGVAATVTAASTTELTATVPTGTLGSDVDVTVETAGGVSGAINASKFHYAKPLSVTAAFQSATVAPGDTATLVLTITNSDSVQEGFYAFDVDNPTATIMAGAASGPNGAFYYVSDGARFQLRAGQPASLPIAAGASLVVTVPYTVLSNTAHGAYSVTLPTITSQYGGFDTSGPTASFTVGIPPTVSGVAPNTGPVAGGRAINIGGTGFLGATGVTIGGVPATDVVVVNNTFIKATSPAGSLGSASVIVTTPGGSNAANTLFNFVLPPPTVTDVSVRTGPARGGTAVTITGTNFFGTPQVTFGGGAASNVTLVSETSITAESPSGAGVVDVVITTLGGTSTTGSADQFTYISPPTTTAFDAPAIAYNPGSAAATTFSAAGYATNSPTSYAVDSTSTAGSVSIDNAGTISYTPPVGFRGVDLFYYTATNAGGPSSGNRVTVTVGNPTLTTVLNGSGAARGSSLTGYALATTGGAATYSCNTTLASGALPSGVSLNSNCSLTGTPTAAGAFTFTASVSDSSTGTGPFTQTSGTLALTVAKQSQTITFDNPGVLIFGTSPSLTATSTSNLPVTFSSASPAVCTVTTGGTLTLVGAGTCTITAEQAGDANYSAATPWSRNLLVGKASQTIAFSNPGAQAIGATPTLTATASSALAVTFTSATTSVCTVTSGGALSFITSGTCTINANQAGDSGHHAAAQVSQSFTVGKASQTITFNNPGAQTLGATPTLTASASSGLTVTFASATTNVCTITAGGTLTLAAPGTCTVNADQAGDGAYSAATQVSQSFTVNASAPMAGDVFGGSAGYNTAGATFDLSPFITGGTATSVAIVSAPTHGTTSVAGTGVTYIPTTGYSGADTFTYTATGPGGTSNLATVYLTVTTPGAPVAANRAGVAIAFNSSGTAIDLSSSISGVHSVIAVGSYPAHGTASASGDVVTYIPATGYAGADSFTYIATGPGGASTPATVSLTVAAPAAPTVTEVSPTGGPTTGGGGRLIVLRGANLLVATVTLGGQTVVIDGTHSATEISFHAPAAAAGPKDIVVTTPGGSVTLTGAYTYADLPAGTASATFSPATVGVSARSTLAVTLRNPTAQTLTGMGAWTALPSNLVADAATLGGTCSGASLQFGGSILIVEQVNMAANGTCVATVEVHSATGGSYSFAPGNFIPPSYDFMGSSVTGVAGPAAVLTVATLPAITGLDVTSGSSVGGTAVTLTGTDLDGTTGVTVGGVAATNLAVVSAAEVRFTTPAGAAGAADVVVTTDAGAATKTGGFTYVAPPVAGSSSATVAYGSHDNVIALSLSGGTAASLAVTTLPTGGTVTVSGASIRYTPAAGFIGADSFAYTATNGGGTSAPATVSITVSPPAVPVAADRSGVAVAYNSAGAAIDLAAAITGVHASLSVTTAPAHGTASVSGDVVTYVPTPGYHGPDSFSYTAAGPGGTSTPATVGLTVAVPAAPVAAERSSVAVDFESAGTAIDLSTAITGVHTAIAIGAPPVHGTAAVSGDVVTYTPAAGYLGADSFTYTATGPGGVSAPATVTVTVGAPPAPTARDFEVQVAHGMARQINLADHLGGVRTTVVIAAAPNHGAATLNGDVVTYTPAAGYAGPDSFTFTATGPGGSSPPATVSLTVGAAPEATAQALTIKVDPSATGSNTAAPVEIDLSQSVRNAVAIEIITEPRNGVLTIDGLSVTYTPNAGFYGTDSFTYRAVGAGVSDPATRTSFAKQALVTGPVSAPATVTIVIAAPPITAPSLSANGLQGKTVSVNLTAGAQGGPFTAAAIVTPPASAAGTATIVSEGADYVMRFTPAGAFSGAASVTYTLSNASGTSLPGTVTFTIDARPNPLADAAVLGLASAAVEDARRFGSTQVELFGRRLEQLHAEQRQSGNRIALAMAGATQIPLGRLNPTAGRWSAWADGVISIGKFSPNAIEFDLTTDGLAAGIDRRFSDRFSFGVGAGYGHGKTDSAPSRLETDNAMLAAYGSWRPTKDMFVDGLIGAAKLAHDTQRTTASNIVVSGARDGSMTLGSLTTGFDRQHDELRLSYYGRVNLIEGSLDPYTETGDPTWALAYGKQSLSSTSVALGARMERAFDFSAGRFVPRLRFEYQRELRDMVTVTASYADWAASPIFSEALTGVGKSQLLLGAGADVIVGQGRYTFDYSARSSNDRDIEHRLSAGGAVKF